MAVFTQVSAEELAPHINRFNLGSITRLEGISSGIENTNYFLDTFSQGETRHWVLTIFENMDPVELPFFVSLTQHLANKGLKVPAPLSDANGQALFRINDKDALIVPCLDGRAHVSVSARQCAEAARWLAKMHNAVADFRQSRPLVRDLQWMEGYSEKLEGSSIPPSDLALLRSCIKRYISYRGQLAACPHGIVHGDLFRDNALFLDGEVSGVIDFYHACQAGLLFDLAVCANDWVTDVDGSYNQEKFDALVQAYQAERAWTEAEQEAWPRFLEVAALRFWISRLASKYLEGYQQDSMEGETIKDPDEMRRILEHVLGL